MEILSLNRSQRRGAVTIVCAILSITIIRYFHGKYLVEKLPGGAAVEEVQPPPAAAKATVGINTADSAAFEALPGIGPVLSSRIVKFRRIKGGFDSKEDLLQVYGLDSAAWLKIAELLVVDSYPESDIPQKHVQYSEKKTGPQKKKNNYKEKPEKKWPEKKSWKKPEKQVKTYQAVDINLADEAALEALPGIGQKIAGRIVKYRNLLGFYHSVEQLHEVYGFRDTLFQIASPYLLLQASTDTFTLIAINEGQERDLVAHPYIDWPLAKRIVAYRNEHGPFGSAEELTQVHGVDQEDVVRLKPYLGF